MKQYLPLPAIEAEYKKAIEQSISENSKLTPDLVIQLSVELFNEPGILKEDESYDSWSRDFKNLPDWVKNIKSTNGYLKLKQSPYRSYNLSFFKV